MIRIFTNTKKKAVHNFTETGHRGKKSGEKPLQKFKFTRN